MNTFYHGDCLFVLKHDILPESIDLIYLDPPFFTGKIQTGQWRPDAMEVSFEDSKKFWKEKGGSIYAPEWMKHIAVKRPDFASYLYYMMERLQACHKIIPFSPAREFREINQHTEIGTRWSNKGVESDETPGRGAEQQNEAGILRTDS